MTTLATADLHLSANPRDAYRFHFLETTLPTLVREHSARRVLVLGDLTEVKDQHRAPFVNRVVDGFVALAEEADVYVLRGNHDYIVEDSPFYHFLGHIPRIHWINQPTARRLRGLGACLFLPHTSDPSAWSDYDLGEYAWVLCHQMFTGADFGHGRQAEGGADPMLLRGRNFQVISGDVHVPQTLGKRITYIGAPYHVDFGDEYEARVILLDGPQMRSVPVVGPQKRLVHLTSLDHLERTHVPAGDIVKVRVETDGGDVTALGRPHIRRMVREWAERGGVVLHEVQLSLTEGGWAERRDRGQPERRSDEELMRAYVRARGADRTTLAAGQKIVEKVG